MLSFAILWIVTPLSATPVWEPCAPMPTPRMDEASATVNDTLYVIGGQRTTGIGEEIVLVDNVEAYVASTDEWITGYPPIPVPLAAQACAVLDGRIYLFGGVDENGEVAQVVWHWKPGESSWRIASLMMPNPIQGGAALAAGDGGILIIGGITYDGQFGSGVYRFLPGVGFSTEPSLEQERGRCGVGLSSEGIIAVGGYFHGPLSSTEILDREMWRPGPELPGARGGHLICSVGGTVFAVGGQGTGAENGGLLRNVVSLPVGGHSWVVMPSMDTPRTLLAGGVVYDYLIAAGGLSDIDGQPTGWTERIAFETLASNFESAPLPNISVIAFPNPSRGQCTVYAIFPQSGRWSLMLNDLAGREIYRTTGHSEQIELALNSSVLVNNGIYVLKAVMDDSYTSIPITVIR